MYLWPRARRVDVVQAVARWPERRLVMFAIHGDGAARGRREVAESVVNAAQGFEGALGVRVSRF
jgi:hypothetical protein